MTSKIAMLEAKAVDIGPRQHQKEELHSNRNKHAADEDKTEYYSVDDTEFTVCTNEHLLDLLEVIESRGHKPLIYREYPESLNVSEYLKHLEQDKNGLSVSETVMRPEETENRSTRDLHKQYMQLSTTWGNVFQALEGGLSWDVWEEEETCSFPTSIPAGQRASFDVFERRFLANAGIRVSRHSGERLQILMRESATNTAEEYQNGKIEETEYQFTDAHWPRSAVGKPSSKTRDAQSEALRVPVTTRLASTVAIQSSSLWQPRLSPFLHGLFSPQADHCTGASLHIAEPYRLLRTTSTPEIRVVLCLHKKTPEPLFSILQLNGEDNKCPSNHIEKWVSISEPRIWSWRQRALEPIDDSGLVLLLSLHSRLGRYDCDLQADTISVVSVPNEEAETESSTQFETTDLAASFARRNWRQGCKTSDENVSPEPHPLPNFCRQSPIVSGEEPIVLEPRVSGIDSSRDLSPHLPRGIASILQLIKEYVPVRSLTFFSLLQLSIASPDSSKIVIDPVSLSPAELLGTCFTAFALLSSAVLVDSRIERADKIKLGALLELVAIFSWNVVDDLSGGYPLLWIPILLTLMGLLILSRALIRVRRGCSRCGEESCGGDCGSGSSTGGDDHV